MAHETLEVAADAAGALDTIRGVASDGPVLVFKRSPICPVSHRAEAELGKFLSGLDGARTLTLVSIDVIAEKPLARGLTAELDIAHESPQALWFEKGELSWHGSHGALTAERFSELLKGGA